MLESENEGKREYSNHGLSPSNVEGKKIVSLLLHVDSNYVPFKTCTNTQIASSPGPMQPPNCLMLHTKGLVVH